MRLHRPPKRWAQLLLLAAPLIMPAAADAQSSKQEWNTAWYVRPPYQMEVRKAGLNVLSGLDIRITEEALAGTDYRPIFEPRSWSDGLQGLQDGSLHFIPGAYWLKERTAYARYSIPYRIERNVLYAHRDRTELLALKTLPDLFALLEQQPLRLAFTEGFAFGNDEIMAYFRAPPPTLELVPSTG